MAGDWIKMRTDLYRDPKVIMISDILASLDGPLGRYVNQNMQSNMCVTRNVMRNVTVGALVSVWGVLRHRGKRDGDDLFVGCCSTSVIDDLADIPGFGDAMESVGWAKCSSKGIVFPNFFADYNSDPKERAREKNAERQRRFREKQKEKDNVTNNVTVTHRVEKSREENIYGSSNDEPPAKNDYPDWFEEIWRIKPKRDGADPKRQAFQSCNARLKAGRSVDDLKAGLIRYRRYLEHKGMDGTDKQMQMVRFFGKGEEYRESWSTPSNGPLPPNARMA